MKLFCVCDECSAMVYVSKEEIAEIDSNAPWKCNECRAEQVANQLKMKRLQE